MASAPEISPELVLVCPELGDQARAALPDRPWELFLPAVPAAEVLALRPPSPERVPRAHAEEVQRPPRRHRRVPIAPILVLAFTGLVVVGSVLPTRDAPRLGPLPAQAGTTVAVPTSTSASTTAPQTTTTTPTPAITTSLPPLPLRSASGYALTNGKGFVLVAPGARSIAEFRVVLPCAGTIVLRRIAIGANGHFDARRVGSRARPPLELRGTVDLLRAVSGTIRMTAGPCRGASLRFLARLS